jgi:hypothetical protein
MKLLGFYSFPGDWSRFARIVTHLEAIIFGVGLRVPDSFNLQHTFSVEAENGTKESGRQACPMNEMQRSFVTVECPPEATVERSLILDTNVFYDLAAGLITLSVNAK